MKTLNRQSPIKYTSQSCDNTSLCNFRKKLESQKEELDHLKKVLDSKEEIEKKQSGK